MQVGTAQSQTQSQIHSRSVVASLSITTEVTAQKVATQEGGSADAVLLTMSRTVDFSYAEQVLRSEVQDQLDSALKDAGFEEGVEGLLTDATDRSPEATANRILDFATSFLAGFQANHADWEASRQIQDFSQLIRGAVDAGFAQSRDILEGIAKLADDVSADIDETQRLVMSGIDDFEQDRLQVISATQPPAEAAADADADLLAL